jgi:hypothetical protein
MATRKMKDGRWFCQIENKEVYGGNGRGPSKSGFATKAKAKEWEELTLATDKKRKGMADKRDATMGDLAEAYKDYLDDRVAAGTLQRGTRRLMLIGVRLDIVPRFGHVKCDDFSTSMAQAMIRDFAGHNGKCQNTMRSLYGMIGEGVRQGYFASHPFEPNNHPIKPTAPCRRGDDEIPTAEELIRLKEIVTQPMKAFQDEREWLQDQAFFFLGLHHGLRHGEVVALRRAEVCGAEGGDVDLRRGVLHIRKNWCNVGSELKKPKSAPGIRSLEMTNSMWSLMERLINLPPGNKLGLIFTSRRGGDYYGQLNARWLALMTKAGYLIENEHGKLEAKFKFHSLRHVLGSVLLAQGKPIPFCARVLGHKQETFIKTYSRELAALEGSTREALQLVERVYNGERVPLLKTAKKTQNAPLKVLRIGRSA